MFGEDVLLPCRRLHAKLEAQVELDLALEITVLVGKALPTSWTFVEWIVP